MKYTSIYTQDFAPGCTPVSALALALVRAMIRATALAPVRAVPLRCLAFLLAALLPAALLLALEARPALAHKVNIFATVEAGNITGEGYFGAGAKAQNTPVEVQDALGALAASTRTDAKGFFSVPVPQGARLPLRVVLKAGDGHQNDYPVTARDLGLPPGAETTPLAGATPATSPDTRKASPATGGGAAAPAPPGTVSGPTGLVSGPSGGVSGPPGAAAPSATGSDAGGGTGMPSPAHAAKPAAPEAGAATPAAASPGVLGGTPQEEAVAALVEAAVAKAVEEKIAPLRMEISRLADNADKAKVRDIVGGLGWIAGLFGLAAFLRGRGKGNGKP